MHPINSASKSFLIVHCSTPKAHLLPQRSSTSSLTCVAMNLIVSMISSLHDLGYGYGFDLCGYCARYNDPCCLALFPCPGPGPVWTSAMSSNHVHPCDTIPNPCFDSDRDPSILTGIADAAAERECLTENDDLGETLQKVIETSTSTVPCTSNDNVT